MPLMMRAVISSACQHPRRRATNAAMPDFLTAYAAAHPDKDRRHRRPARPRLSSTLTYAELGGLSNRLANVLLGLGVLPNTKVVWCGQNSIGVVAIINAARKIGATAVPLNYRLSDEEAAYVTDHSDAVLVYVDAEFAPMFERIRGQLPKVATYPRVRRRGAGRDGVVRRRWSPARRPTCRQSRRRPRPGRR